MTTQCAMEGCGSPVTPCTGACIRKIEGWRAEARKPVTAGIPGFEQTLNAIAAKPASAPDIDVTLKERGERYGKFKEHARITMQMKNYIREELEKREKDLAYDQLEALDMICHKIGRIINGDPNYADSWVDIAGYAKLVADRLEGVVT